MMNGWLSLTDDERRATLQQAYVLTGIQSKAIEKDWWVTQTLKALYTSSYAPHCIFKGGTSLSKGWKLINRFSEDVDIALSPEAFGMMYLEAASHTYVKRLKRKGCECTTVDIKRELEISFQLLGIPVSSINVVAESVPGNRPDKDPQTLFVKYTSLFDPHPYLSDEVRIEFSVRSLKEPFETISVQPILNEAFPNEEFAENLFNVPAAHPKKTLLEKLFLLHEKFNGNQRPIVGDRLSRHLYDIFKLSQMNFAINLFDDRNFYYQLLNHRSVYVRMPGVDYANLYCNPIKFVPPDEILHLFEKDYLKMRESFIYNDAPEFDMLINELRLFSKKFEDWLRDFQASYHNDHTRAHNNRV